MSAYGIRLWCLLCAVLAWQGYSGTAVAQLLAPAEIAKIEVLIRHVQGMQDAVFVRNGKDYDGNVAARFLRRKWESKHDEISSARDFIDKVASVSSTTGQAYHIKLKNGQVLTSREYLLVQLANLESR